MDPQRRLPTKGRPGKQAWLGPVALCLGLLSWLAPVLGIPFALGAVTCGAVSMSSREYRIDWMAAAGVGIGLTQVLASLLLLTATAM